MTRHKGYANGRTGLWQDTPEQPYVPAHDLRIEEQTSPLTRACPHCHAAPRQPCTSPSRRPGGRRNLSGYHASRLDPSGPETHPQETT